MSKESKTTKVDVMVYNVNYVDSPMGDYLEKIREDFKSPFGKLSAQSSGPNGWIETYDVKKGKIGVFKKQYKDFWKNAKVCGLRVNLNPKGSKDYGKVDQPCK